MLLLLKADAVFAGQDAADLHAEFKDLPGYPKRVLGVAGLALVEQDGGVEIAVAGVEQVCYRVAGAV